MKDTEIHLLSDLSEFRGTIVKLYLIENNNIENISLPTTKSLLITQNILLNISSLPTAENPPIITARHSRI